MDGWTWDDMAVQREVAVHLALAERHGFKLVIVGGADAWRMASVLRERQVLVVIAGVHRLPLRRDEEYDAPYRLAARLAEAGVTYSIGRAGGALAAANERNLPYEAGTAVAHGLSRDEALKAITLYTAQILGAAERLGTLAPGRLAAASSTMATRCKPRHRFCAGSSRAARSRSATSRRGWRTGTGRSTSS